MAHNLHIRGAVVDYGLHVDYLYTSEDSYHVYVVRESGQLFQHKSPYSAYAFNLFMNEAEYVKIEGVSWIRQKVTYDPILGHRYYRYIIGETLQEFSSRQCHLLQAYKEMKSGEEEMEWE